MSTKLRIFVFMATILFDLYLLNTLKKDKVSLKYLLSWIFVSNIILLITIKPVILEKFTFILGIYNPMNALFFLGFIFILPILYINTISQSRNSDRLKILVQEIAIKNYESNRTHGDEK